MKLLKRLWALVIYIPPVWVLVLNQLLLVQTGVAEGHSKAIVDCKENILYKQAKKVAPDQVVGSTGFIAEYYDTNKDGKSDVVAMSHLSEDGKSHNPNPVFWSVDINYDGQPDAIYIDKKGLGVCTDIVLYEDLHMPHETQDIDHGGRL